MSQWIYKYPKSMSWKFYDFSLIVEEGSTELYSSSENVAAGASSLVWIPFMCNFSKFQGFAAFSIN